MTIEEIATYVESLGGVLTLRPGPGDGTPEVAWGDLFFYYAPDGVVPRSQPFATVVTKDYPHEPSSRLDGPDAFRVNVGAGRRGLAPPADPTERDAVLPHPVYAAQGWVCVVEPAARTHEELHALLAGAHADAARRWTRRRE